MTKQFLYLLGLLFFIQVSTSANPPSCPGSGCEKKVCAVKTAETKKSTARTKKSVAAVRPLNFYLFNF